MGHETQRRDIVHMTMYRLFLVCSLPVFLVIRPVRLSLVVLGALLPMMALLPVSSESYPQTDLRLLDSTVAGYS